MRSRWGRWAGQVFGRLAGVAEERDFSTPQGSARNDRERSRGPASRTPHPVSRSPYPLPATGGIADNEGVGDDFVARRRAGLFNTINE